MEKLRQRLVRKPVHELLGIAKELEVQGASKLSKAQLIELICKEDTGDIKRAAGLTFVDRYHVKIGLLLGVLGVFLTIFFRLVDLDDASAGLRDEISFVPNAESRASKRPRPPPIFDPEMLKINYIARTLTRSLKGGSKEELEHDMTEIRKELMSAYTDDIVSELRAKAALESDLKKSIAFLTAAADHAPRDPAVAYDLGQAHLFARNYAEAKAQFEQSLSERTIYAREGYPEPLSIRSALASANFGLGFFSAAASEFGDVLVTLRAAHQKYASDHPDLDWPTLDIGITWIQTDGATILRSPITTKVDLLYLEGSWATALLVAGKVPEACNALDRTKKSYDELRQNKMAASLLGQDRLAGVWTSSSSFLFDLKVGLSLCRLREGELVESEGLARDAYKQLPLITGLPAPTLMPNYRHVKATIVLALIALQSGELQQAVGLSNRALDYIDRALAYQGIADKRGQPSVLAMSTKAFALVGLNRLEEARRAAEVAVEWNLRLEISEQDSIPHQALAVVLALGPSPDLQAARNHLAKAFDLATSTAYSPERMASLHFLYVLVQGDDSLPSDVVERDLRHSLSYARSLPLDNYTRKSIEGAFKTFIRCGKICPLSKI